MPKMLSDPKKEFTCSNCGRTITRGHFVPSSEGGGDWVCEEPIPPDAVRIIDENFWKLVA